MRRRFGYPLSKYVGNAMKQYVTDMAKETLRSPWSSNVLLVIIVPSS